MPVNFRALYGPYKRINGILNGPYSIDYLPPKNAITTINMPQETFGEPVRLKTLQPLESPFGKDAQLGRGEIKIATARENKSGFTTGEVFTSRNAGGDRDQGVIHRISPDGSVNNWWVTLPSPNPMRPEGVINGLHVDRTEFFDGDLIAISITGDVWRIKSTGWEGSNHCPLAMLNRYIEGVVTVPNIPKQYGPWAGKILVGAPTSDLNRLWGVEHLNDPDNKGIIAISPNGYTELFSSKKLHMFREAGNDLPAVAINVHDITIIPREESLYSVQYAGTDDDRTAVWGSPSSDFNDMRGDILVQERNPHISWLPPSGFWRLGWDYSTQDFYSELLPVGFDVHSNNPNIGDYVHQWTGMKFIPLRIV